jgi:hypothetical protein
LVTLRSVTDTTGAVHEAQLEQLRFWGGIAFSPLAWHADVDAEGHKVTYTLAKISKDRNLPNVVAALDRSLHWLLGETWQLVIVEAGSTIYSGSFMSTSEYIQKARTYRKAREEESVKNKRNRKKRGK